MKNIFLNYKIDGVINFAAESHVDNSISGPEIFIKTNINGTKSAKSCLNNWMDNLYTVKILIMQDFTKYQLMKFMEVLIMEVLKKQAHISQTHHILLPKQVLICW